MIDAKNYPPNHALLDLDCEHPVPSQKSVKAVPARNKVPVITISDEKSENSIVQLAVLESSEAPYVAMPAFGADGLGSSTEKGLRTYKQC